MATGQKISAQNVATTFESTDIMTIVQGGTNKSVTHDVLMDDTQICKVWAHFDGDGTVSIYDDFNVSSITDNGTGDYTINYTNALNDANYSIVGITGESNVYVVESDVAPIRTVNAIRILSLVSNSGGTPNDADRISVQIFGS